MLPIALGEATKLAGRMLDATKVYEFTIRFGEETDTLDAEGEVVATSATSARRSSEVEAVLPRFTGAIEQVPPAYSALKIDGKPAYARARAGEEVEMKARTVTIHALRLARRRSAGRGRPSPPPSPRAPTSAASPATSPGRSERSATSPCCGGPGPARSAWKRRFRWTFWTNAAKARAARWAVLPLTAALDDIPALPVTPDQAQLLRQGQKLAGIPATPGLQLATDGERPVALVEASADGLRVVRGFNL